MEERRLPNLILEKHKAKADKMLLLLKFNPTTIQSMESKEPDEPQICERASIFLSNYTENSKKNLLGKKIDALKEQLPHFFGYVGKVAPYLTDETLKILQTYVSDYLKHYRHEEVFKDIPPDNMLIHIIGKVLRTYAEHFHDAYKIELHEIYKEKTTELSQRLVCHTLSLGNIAPNLDKYLILRACNELSNQYKKYKKNKKRSKSNRADKLLQPITVNPAAGTPMDRAAENNDEMLISVIESENNNEEQRQPNLDREIHQKIADQMLTQLNFNPKTGKRTKKRPVVKREDCEGIAGFFATYNNDHENRTRAGHKITKIKEILPVFFGYIKKANSFLNDDSLNKIGNFVLAYEKDHAEEKILGSDLHIKLLFIIGKALQRYATYFIRDYRYQFPRSYEKKATDPARYLVCSLFSQNDKEHILLKECCYFFHESLRVEKRKLEAIEDDESENPAGRPLKFSMYSSPGMAMYIPPISPPVNQLIIDALINKNFDAAEELLQNAQRHRVPNVDYLLIRKCIDDMIKKNLTLPRLAGQTQNNQSTNFSERLDENERLKQIAAMLNENNNLTMNRP